MRFARLCINSFLGVLLLVLLAHGTAFAAGSQCQQTDLGCLPPSPIDFAQQMYKIGMGLIGGVGVIFLIFGGYLVLTSRGDPTQLKNGKTYIVSALIGLLLAVFGYVFISVLTGDILHLPGFQG